MSPSLEGQDETSVAINTPAGVFVLLGKEFPKVKGYEVDRAQNEGDKVNLGGISGPENYQDLLARHQFYASKFEHLKLSREELALAIFTRNSG